MAKTQSVKRYNLVLPEVLFDELQSVATRRGVTVLEVIRQFVKLGLLVAKTEDTPEAVFVIRDGSGERELTFIW